MRRRFFKRQPVSDQKHSPGPRLSRGPSQCNVPEGPLREFITEIEILKSKAIRTEELTQRSTRFNFQIAIDLRELMQSEFVALEKMSTNRKVRDNDLKLAVMEFSGKISAEIINQMEIEKRLADAYGRMEDEVVNNLKELSKRVENSRLPHRDKSTFVQYIGDIASAVEDACEHWATRLFLGTKRLYEMKKESPKDIQELTEMYERIERLLKLCYRTTEHPLSGVVSISKEFLRLNLQYRDKFKDMDILNRES